MQALPSPAKRIIDKSKQISIQKIIDLSHQQLGPLHLQIILTENQWQHLQEIQLNNNNLGEEGTSILLQTHWPNLNSINIASNNLGDTGIEHINLCGWPLLVYISLYNNNITSKGCHSLSRCCWSNLIKINIGNNPIGNSGIRLLTRGDFPKVSNLFAHSCELEDQAFFAIAKSKWNIKYLKLSKNNIHRLRGIEKTGWRELKYLILDDNKISEDSLLRILKCSWPELKTLQLNKNWISQSVRHLGLIERVCKKLIVADRILF